MNGRNHLFLDTDSPLPGGGGGAATTPASIHTAPNAAPSAPPPSIPVGHRLVRDEDYTRFEAANRAYSDLGFTDPSEAGKYKSLIDTIRTSKRDPALLAQMFGESKRDDAKGQAEPLDEAALEARVYAKMRRTQAWDAHKERTKSFPATVQAKVKELLGGDDPELGPLLADSIMYKLEQARLAAYDKPGADPDMPTALTDEERDAIFKPYGDLAKTLRGKMLKAIGDAANKGRQGSVAGDTGKQGKPEGDAADGDKPFSKRSRAEKEALAASLIEAGNAAKGPR